MKEVSVPMHLQGGHIWTAVGAEGIYKTQFCGGGQDDNYSADYGADMVAAFHKGMSAHAHRLEGSLFVMGEAFLLTVGAILLTVELLCLQSLKALIRRTFPL